MLTKAHLFEVGSKSVRGQFFLDMITLVGKLKLEVKLGFKNIDQRILPHVTLIFATNLKIVLL